MAVESAGRLIPPGLREQVDQLRSILLLPPMGTWEERHSSVKYSFYMLGDQPKYLQDSKSLAKRGDLVPSGNRQWFCGPLQGCNGQLEFRLDDHGLMHSTYTVSGKMIIQRITKLASPKYAYDAAKVKDVWCRVMEMLLKECDCTTSIDSLEEMCRTMTELMALLNDFNKMYEKIKGVANPQFDDLVEQTVKGAVSIFILPSGEKAATLNGLIAWTFLGKQVAQWREYTTRYRYVGGGWVHSTESTVREAVNTGLRAYSEALELVPYFGTSVLHFPKTVCGDAFGQLEGMALTEAGKQHLHPAGTLMMGSLLSSVLGTPLPLKGDKLSVECLLSLAVLRHNLDLHGICSQMGPCIQQSIMDLGHHSFDIQAERFAHCIMYLCEMLNVKDDIEKLCQLVMACAPVEHWVQAVCSVAKGQGPFKHLFTFKPKPTLAAVLDKFRADRSGIIKLLACVANLQFGSKMQPQNIVEMISDVLGSEAFAKNHRELADRGDELVCEVLRGIVVRNQRPTFAREVIEGVVRAGCIAPKQLCEWLLVATHHAGREVAQMPVDVWVAIMSTCGEELGAANLVLIFLRASEYQPLDLYTRLVACGRIFEEPALRDVLHEAVEKLGMFTLSVRDLTSQDILTGEILRHWVPSLDLAPPGSARERNFLEWLRASGRIARPLLLDQRVKIGDGLPLGFMNQDEFVQKIVWSKQWASFSEVHWPNLRELCEIFVLGEHDRAAPKVVQLFEAVWDAAASGHLPADALTFLASARTLAQPEDTAPNVILQNIRVSLQYVSRAVPELSDVLEMQLARHHELRRALEQQMQLLHWLVTDLRFTDSEEQLETLKKLLANITNLSVVELMVAVDEATNTFGIFGSEKTRGDLMDFLQHCLRHGSVLLKPLLEHFATEHNEKRARFARHTGGSPQARMDKEALSSILNECYLTLHRLALGCELDQSRNSKIDVKVWKKVVEELTKDLPAMPRQLDIVFSFFSRRSRPSGLGPSALAAVRNLFGTGAAPPDVERRRAIVEDACRLEAVIDAMPMIERTFDHFHWSWARTCKALTRTRESIEEHIELRDQVDIEMAAGRMTAICGWMGLARSLDLGIFQVLAQRAAVFDFFRERRERFGADMSRFEETWNFVRASLQEEKQARLGLLEELHNCFAAFRVFLSTWRSDQEEPADPVASDMVREAIVHLATHRIRADSFSAVAEQLPLMKAMFDDTGGTGGVQLLLYTVRELLKGHIHLNPFDGTYHCTYTSGRATVTISAQGLKEYVQKCSMSLGEAGQSQSDVDLLKLFLRQLEAFLTDDGGLRTASQALCKEGHPKFRRQVSFALAENDHPIDLAATAKEHADELSEWRQHLSETFERAPVLGLVPRTQVFAWMTRMATSGVSEDLLAAVSEAYGQWCQDFRDTEDLYSRVVRRLAERLGQDTPLDPGDCLGALVCFFEGAVVASERTGGIRGRSVIHADDVSPDVLHLMVVQEFMDLTPPRLPKLAEVLFCSEDMAEVDVKAFMWRCDKFPQLFFVLVEPNRLPSELKDSVGRWLVHGQATGNVKVILTSQWHLPRSSHIEHVHNVRLNRGLVTERWRSTCPVEVLLYSTERMPRFGMRDVQALGTGSGKTTAIAERCRDAPSRRIPCVVHEGFDWEAVLRRVRELNSLEDPVLHVALHLDLSAYSEPATVNMFLRNLLLCGTLFDPATGTVVPRPPMFTVHAELGPLVPHADVYSLREYSTRDRVAAMFRDRPSVSQDALHLGLLFPLLGLLGQDGADVVNGARLYADEGQFPPPAGFRSLNLEGEADNDEAESDDGDEGDDEATPPPVAADVLPDLDEVDVPVAVGSGMATVFKVMHAATQDHPLDSSRRFVDVRPADLENALAFAEAGEHSPGLEALQTLLALTGRTDSIEVRFFPAPDDPATCLTAFAMQHCEVYENMSRAQEVFFVRLMSVFAQWMTVSPMAREDGSVEHLGSLLLSIVVAGLRKTIVGQEACVYFIPVLCGDSVGDFRIFLPSLDPHPKTAGLKVCHNGGGCQCNFAVGGALKDLRGQVLYPEFETGSREVDAEMNTNQCEEALACAFGLSLAQVSELLKQEHYVLTRDFTCKFLELDWRRKAGVPVIIEGESGAGKSRLLMTYTRLLMESNEVKPPILRGLFNHMNKAVHDYEKSIPDGPERVRAVKEHVVGLLTRGFSVDGLMDLLMRDEIWQVLQRQVGPPEPLFTPESLNEYLIDRLRSSKRYDRGLLNYIISSRAVGQEGDGLIGETEADQFERLVRQWRVMPAAAQDEEREKNTLALLTAAEVNDQGVLLQLVNAISELPPEPIYFPVQLHANVSPNEYRTLIQPALNAARRERGMTIVLFLDEVNTSSCLGLIKSTVCDGLTKEYPNLLIVAAGNPYRPEGSSRQQGKSLQDIVPAMANEAPLAYRLQMQEDAAASGGAQPEAANVMRDFFQVHPFPESFAHVKWLWRPPNKDAEMEYVLRRLTMTKAVPASDAERFAQAIVDAQHFMRKTLGSESAVSQRDIIRMFTFLRFFREHLQQREGGVVSERGVLAKAVLLSFGVVYYLGLDTVLRGRFVNEVTRPLAENLSERGIDGTLQLPLILTEELDYYFANITLPHGIAATRALKENVFVVILGAHCNVPVTLVGMPGTGKTLAVNIATEQLRGKNGADRFFKHFVDVANSVIRYQCSKESTSAQICEVFEQGLRDKKRFDQNKEVDRRALVFIDEAALPDEKVESLKAIHYYIDRGDLPCVLLANKPLDAAKRNRAVQVFRDASDRDDLTLLVIGALGLDRKDSMSQGFVLGLCKAFELVTNAPGSQEMTMIQRPDSFNIFHLRDFTLFLQHLRRHGLRVGSYFSNMSVLRALERNFGGLVPLEFSCLVDVFFEMLGMEMGSNMVRPDAAQLRTVIAVLQDAIADLPSDIDIQSENFQPCRFKMIVDETDDGSAIRMLQDMAILPNDVDIIEVSDLPGDRSQMHASTVVSAIRLAAAHPGIVVVTDFGGALDGFYDLLNLRYTRTRGHDGSVGFSATVAAGSHTVLASVHPRFQMFVCVRAQDLPSLPLPLLNRFEKYRIGSWSAAVHRAGQLVDMRIKPDVLRDHILGEAAKRLEPLVQLLSPASLIGYQGPAKHAEFGQTIWSLLHRALGSPKMEEALRSLATIAADGRVERAAERPPTPAARPTKVAPPSVPADLEAFLVSGVAEDWEQNYANLQCYGHENVGTTCYLQVALTLLALHGQLLRPNVNINALPRVIKIAGQDLESVVMMSLESTVERDRMKMLESSLSKLDIIQRSTQQDAAETFEQLLGTFGGQSLPLNIVTVLAAQDLARVSPAGLEGLPGKTDSTDMVLRVALPEARASVNLVDLIDNEMFSEISERAKLKAPSGTIEVKYSRCRQRREGQLPPKLLPVCVGRWKRSTSCWGKSDIDVEVPMQGLRVRVLGPQREPFEDGPVEAWSYNLRSFAVHQGTCDAGHYKAYWQRGSRWQCVDDDKVCQISLAEAQKQAKGAYLLVFELAGLAAAGHPEPAGAAGAASPVGESAQENKRFNEIRSAIVVDLTMEAAAGLLQLAPSETIVHKERCLPAVLKERFASDPHFGLGGIIRALASGSMDKCVALTRDTGVSGTEGLAARADAELKPMPRSRENMEDMFKKHLKVCEQIRLRGDASLRRPLVVWCRLGNDDSSRTDKNVSQSSTSRAVHQLRRCADRLGVAGLVVVLLLPARRLHLSQCYGAVFVGGWSFYHVDTLEDTEAPYLVPSLLLKDTMPDDMDAGPFADQWCDAVDFEQDLYSAVNSLPASPLFDQFVKQWSHSAGTFYSKSQLQDRVKALQVFLRQPGRLQLWRSLQRLHAVALQGFSLWEETRRAATAIICGGTGGRPLQSLQATVRAFASEKLTGLLAVVLHMICDQGGLKALADLGGPCVEAAVALVDVYTRQGTSAAASTQLVLTIPDARLALVPPFFANVFNGLQTCLQQTSGHVEEPAPGIDPRLFEADDEDSPEAWLEAWAVNPLSQVGDAIAKDENLFRAYCGYALRCFQMPSELKPIVLQWAWNFAPKKRLQSLHALCRRRRTELAALGMLVRIGLPDRLLESMRPSHDDEATGMLLTEELGAVVVTFLRKELERILQPVVDIDEELGKWRRSFETVHAVFGHLSRLETQMQLFLLKFLSDLIPAVTGGSGQTDLLVSLWRDLQGDTEDLVEMQHRCLRVLAGYAMAAPEDRLEPCQRVFEGLFSTLDLHFGSSDRHFERVAKLVIDALDLNGGIFRASPRLVPLAFGSSLVQRLLEVTMTKDTWLQALRKIVNDKVPVHSGRFWPIHSTVEWPLEQDAVSATIAGDDAAWPSALSHFLFFAFHGQPGLAGVDTAMVSSLQRVNNELRIVQREQADGAHHGGAFAIIRQSARWHWLIHLGAGALIRTVTAGGANVHVAVSDLLQMVDGLEERPTTTWKLFLSALVSRAGAEASASKALKKAVDLAGDRFMQAKTWSALLAKPEVIAEGRGEDPWEDLPVADLPGFESPAERRRRYDAEQEQLVRGMLAVEAKACPNCRQPVCKNGGCDQMECGRHAHANNAVVVGCGHVFSWSAAQPYVAPPSVQRPPGFCAVRDWIHTCGDFLNRAAVQGANAALNGLSPAERRYAAANACACLFLKAGAQNENLADALLSEDCGELRAALGFVGDADGADGRRFARVVSELCMPRAATASTSLAAVALLGRCNEYVLNGEDGEQFAHQFRNCLANLLVTIVGSEGNSHLAMLLTNPYEMLTTFPVGFIFDQMPGLQGYHFDCGCVLNERGEAVDYRGPLNRAPFENRHLHFIFFLSMASLSLGLLLFPDNAARINTILTPAMVERVGFRGAGDGAAEMAQTFAMNFAKEAFHYIHTIQGLLVDDRALCVSELLVRIRQNAGAASGEQPNKRVFASAAERQTYEDALRRTIEAVLQDLEGLRRRALELSKAQQELLQLHEFRQSLSFMQKFFHDFEMCSMMVPGDEDHKFISVLFRLRGELKHLGLLGDIVRIQNWLADRLNGKVPRFCLEWPIMSLIRKRRQVDQNRGHLADAHHCDVVARAVERFVEGWQNFYQDQGGAIAIECQHGREQMGEVAAPTRLEKIEGKGEKLDMRFFLYLGQKSQATIAAEHLLGKANELVDAACSVLEGGAMSAWAAHMRQELPVWLCDILLQHHFQAMTDEPALREKVLSRLSGTERAAPVLNWKRVQEDMLFAHCVHRLQHMNFPEKPAFTFLPEASAGGERASDQKPAMKMPEDLRTSLQEKAGTLNAHELHDCRTLVAWATRVVSSLEGQDAALADKMALEVDGLRSRREFCDAAEDLLEKVRVVDLPGVLQCLEEQHGEFANIPTSLKTSYDSGDGCRLVNVFSTALAKGALPLAQQDEMLREAITQMEALCFIDYLDGTETKKIDGTKVVVVVASRPLKESYENVYCELGVVMGACPQNVLGVHLVATLEALKVCLWQVRIRKTESERGLAWSPEAEDLHALAIEEALEVVPGEMNFWEAPGSEPSEEEALPELEEVPINVGDLNGGPQSLFEVLRSACRGDGRVPLRALRALAEREFVVNNLLRQVLSMAMEETVPLDDGIVMVLVELSERALLKEGSDGGHHHSWLSTLPGVQVAVMTSLLDCGAVRPYAADVAARLLQKPLAEAGAADAEGGDAESASRMPLWHRFVYALGSAQCEELEDTLKECAGDDLPQILRHPSEATATGRLTGSTAAVALLEWLGQYFEVTPLPAAPMPPMAQAPPELDDDDDDEVASVPPSEAETGLEAEPAEDAAQAASPQAPVEAEPAEIVAQPQPPQAPAEAEPPEVLAPPQPLQAPAEAKLPEVAVQPQPPQAPTEAEPTEVAAQPQPVQLPLPPPQPAHVPTPHYPPQPSLQSVPQQAPQERHRAPQATQEPVPAPLAPQPQHPQPEWRAEPQATAPAAQQAAALPRATPAGYPEPVRPPQDASPRPASPLGSSASWELVGANESLQTWLASKGPQVARYFEQLRVEGYEDLANLVEASDEEIAVLVERLSMKKGHAQHFSRGLAMLRGEMPQGTGAVLATTFEEWLHLRGATADHYTEALVEEGYDGFEILRDLTEQDIDALTETWPAGHKAHFKRGLKLLPPHIG